MRVLKALTLVLFVASVPIFLITTNVRLVINAPLLYSYGFDKYDIPVFTGIERSELLSAARQIRDYFNNDEEFLDVRVVQGGVLRGIYSSREIAHMRDVKGLVRGLYLAQVVAGAYLVAFAVFGLAFGRRRSLSRLGRYISIGGLVTLGLVLVVGLAALAGFDRLFLAFHLVSFSNDLWQLDPSRDYLIAMFPEGFFFDATMVIAVFTVVEALFLWLAPLVYLRWRPGRVHTAAREGASEVRVLQ